jgi:hypothetical protein
MAQEAEYHPVGEHFWDPEEEIVDALRCFWQGADFRAHLSGTNPALYRTVKLLDQMSINRCYVPKKGYAGLIRSAQGVLVDNNQSNQKELLGFEQKYVKVREG